MEHDAGYAQDCVLIKAETLKEMIAVCRQARPREACGILGGAAPAMATSVYPIANAAQQPEDTFVYDPASWIDAYYRMQKNQQFLVGFFHSHPRGAAVPSLRDLQGLPAGAAGCYWIVSFRDSGEIPAVRAYALRRPGQALLPEGAGLSMLAEVRVQIA